MAEVEKDKSGTLVDDFSRKIHGLMQCPVCLNHLYPPIRLCRNGHGICARCFDGFNQQCPECRARISKHRRRSIILEEVYAGLVMFCKNKDDGCEFVGLGSKMKNHHKKCAFNTKACPLKNFGCDWKGFESDVSQHLLDIHH